MTKDEFYDEVTDFDELIEFCYNHGCSYIVEDLRKSDDFDSWVWDQLEDLRSSWYWYDLRSALDELEAPSGDYFLPGDGLEYSELGARDLDNYMDDVIDWGNEEDFWDEDDEEWIEIEEDEVDDEEESVFESELELVALIGIA